MKIELVRLIVAGNAMSVALRKSLDLLEENGIKCPEEKSKLIDWQQKLNEYSQTHDLPNLLDPDLIKNDKRFSR